MDILTTLYSSILDIRGAVKTKTREKENLHKVHPAVIIKFSHRDSQQITNTKCSRNCNNFSTTFLLTR